MVAALSWTNRVLSDTDGAVATTVISGAYNTLAIDAGYPAANAINADPSKSTRVNVVGNGTNAAFGVLASWGTNLSTQVVAALNVRLPASGAVGDVSLILRDAAGTQLAASSTLTLASLSPIPGTTDRFDIYWVASAAVNAAQAMLRFTTLGSMNDYVEIGHLWAGPGLVFEGVGSDWTLDAIDPSIVNRGRGGALAATRLPTRDRLSIPLHASTYAQSIGAAGSTLSLRNMIREAGTSSPVVAITRSSDAHASQALSIYGTLVDVPELSHSGGNYFGARLRIEAIR